MKSIQRHIDTHPDPDSRAALSEAFRKLRGSVFAGVMDVVRHLQKRGFKVGKSKVFGDAAKGLLLVQEDKSVFQVDVEEYIIKANLKLKAVDDRAALEDNHAQIKEEEIRGHKLKNEKLEIELKKSKSEIIDSKDAETEKAINLGAFDAAIRHLVRTESHNWILRAGHDPKKLIDIINTDMDEMCNELASRKEITVEVARAAAAA